jgi:hypothetical protein
MSHNDLAAATVLSTGLMLLGFLSIACGLILDTMTRGRREQKLIA